MRRFSYPLRPALTAALLAAVYLLQACAGNPATGGSSVVLGTQGGEAEVGDEMHRKMQAEGAIYPDQALQDYVNRVGQRLVAHSDKPDMTFTFTVVDSPDINAFALPGGYIYVNRGLLAYLDNEAELAGVLGHEIGHVTARHHGRRKAAGVTSSVVAATVYILTGSGQVAEASSMYGQELVSGYGRDLELEADGLGATYMHRAGYATDALLEVIAVLKNQEQYQRVKAKSGGRQLNTYHGLYASHPRNDQRLKTVVGTAATLEPGSATDPARPGEFRQRLEGLPWGEGGRGDRTANRYYHNKLGFTFEHPPGWTVDAGARAIVARDTGGADAMTITVQRLDSAATPRAVLERSAGTALADGRELQQAGLAGYTAVAGDRRVGVLNYNGLSYLFTGRAGATPAQDTEELAAIESFRPLHPRERGGGAARSIHFVQVPQGATLASLAAGVQLADAENLLRLLNGYYPVGEPRTGDWIKTIR